MGLLQQLSTPTGTGRPDTSEAEAKVLEWTNALDEEMRRVRDESQEYADVPRFLDYLRGKQWASGRASYQSSPVINRFFNLYWEKVSLLTDLRLYTGKVYPTRKNSEPFIEAAKALSNVLYAWWIQSDADWGFEMSVIYAMLSTGYAKIPWNPHASDGLGNFELRPYGMDKVMPLGLGGTLQDSEAIGFMEPRSLRWFKQNFGAKGGMVGPSSEMSRGKGSSPADTMSAGMRRILGRHDEQVIGNIPANYYREFWTRDASVNELHVPVIVGRLGTPWCYAVMPNEPLYPRGRLTTRGGDVILDDGPNPNLDGKFPFIELKPFEVPWLPYSMSELRAWITGQDIVNQLLALLLSNLKKGLNPPLLIPKGSIAPPDISGLDSGRAGTKIEYNAMMQATPTWQRQPPPPNIIPIVSLILGELDRMSGVGAAARALGKQQMPAGENFDRIRQAQSTPIRRQERGEERFIRQAAMLGISRICQYYTEDRMFYMAGEQAKPLLHWQPKIVRDLDVIEYEDKKRMEEKKAKVEENWKYKLQPEVVGDLQMMEDRTMRVASTIREFSFYIKNNSLFDLERPTRAAMALKLWMMKGISTERLYSELGIEADSGAELDKIINDVKRLEGAGITLGGGKQRAGHQQTGGGKVAPATK